MNTDENAIKHTRMEEELQQHRQHLEELVKERTAELLEINERLQLEIAEHRQAEEALRESEHRFRMLAESLGEGVGMVDEQEQFTFVNAAAERVFGVSSGGLIGKSLKEFLQPEQVALMQAETEKRRKGEQSTYELEFVQPDGGKRYLLVIATPQFDEAGHYSGALGIFRDITERKRMGEIMVQTEKMMSVGGLAAGMAHEINNPLSGILQSSQNILRRTSPDLPQNVRIAQECGTNLEAIRTYLEKRRIFWFIEGIREAGTRAAQIVANMLNFSRRSDSSKISVNLSALIDKTVELASTDYDLKKQYDFRHIQIIREYEPDLPAVPCVETEINQVLLNLLRNAVQAMASQEDRAEAPMITLRTCREGDMARIEVEDNGPGMDETIRKRIFEPFFTTRDVGVGTGLGLSVSYFIITTNHQGTIRVDSTEGKGTRFIIHLPLERRS